MLNESNFATFVKTQFKIYVEVANMASVPTAQQTTSFFIHLKYTTLFHLDTEQEIADYLVDAHACRLRNPYITVLIAVILFVLIVKVYMTSTHRVAYQNISTSLLKYYKVRI